MAKDLENEFGEVKKETDGLIQKVAMLENQEVTDEELKKINKFPITPLTKEEVFVFKVIAGDNETDDRNFEPFNLNALKDLQKLFIGKPVIKDHKRSAENQIARIYDTELITEPKMTKANEPFTKLICKCYMVKTETNKDLITEIKAGIKKEASTGTRAKHAYCSICGTDNTKTYCPHWGGREYDTKEGKKLCYFTLDGAKEAYELSLVAVPAQKRAGTTKNYGASEKQASIKETIKEDAKELENLKTVENRLRLLDSFIFGKNQEGKENE